MPWKCFIVFNHSASDEKPGAMWPYEHPDGTTHWLVILPNGGLFDTHGKCKNGTGWAVSGEAPNFTTSPSINQDEIRHEDGTLWQQGWHGYLTNGILSDDCEGRTYN